VTSRARLIMAFMVALTLAVGCGTPEPTATEGLRPTHTSPPPTGSTPAAILQPTDTSPPPTQPPSLPPTTQAPTDTPTLPPTALAPTDTPQPPTATATPVPTVESAPEGARVTFLNNAGFLITAGGRRILIDALYSGEPAGVLTSLLEARPPFDAINLILVTHNHADHFSPDLVARAMGHNPEAVFVSTQRVVERLLVVDDSLQDRAIPIQLQAGESEQLDVNGIELEALYISHGNPNLLNLGFVITAGDIRFFHTGDSTAGDISVAYLQSYGLPEMQLDFAFVPYFYLTQQKHHAYALEGIQARYFIPMHYEARQPPLGIEDDFPNAVVFCNTLERWVLPVAAEETPAPAADGAVRPTEAPAPAPASRVVTQMEGLPAIVEDEAEADSQWLSRRVIGALTIG
jgi:L-ascorbate metabolism protein UlaG (beta-lactamase superfamily)